MSKRNKSHGGPKKYKQETTFDERFRAYLLKESEQKLDE